MEPSVLKRGEHTPFHICFVAAARHLRRRMPQEREDAQLLRECRTRLVYMHGTVNNAYMHAHLVRRKEISRRPDLLLLL